MFIYCRCLLCCEWVPLVGKDWCWRLLSTFDLRLQACFRTKTISNQTWNTLKNVIQKLYIFLYNKFQQQQQQKFHDKNRLGIMQIYFFCLIDWFVLIALFWKCLQFCQLLNIIMIKNQLNLQQFYISDSEKLFICINILNSCFYLY